MRRSQAFTLFLLTLLGLFTFAQWGRFLEWWQSLTTLKKTGYAALALAFAALIVSRLF